MKDCGINIDIAYENVRYQHAAGTAFAAEKLVSEGKAVSADILMPQYLRLPQAQRELIAKNKALHS